MRQVLEKLLDDGRDDALLRFTLGSICLQEADAETALVHLQRAIELDPTYSAAWKLRGAAMLKLNRIEEALRIWTEGRAVAQQKGDLQVAREITVFLKRLDKQCMAANKG
ncbi:tetratricopeptide repeat protein [Ensifer sp. HO-A22]|uniref:Tetratricopeptide repeat protein n=1 Tax=Ensifer oleiphilus TaxID=2742698 RepID=A0A7Y6UN51_9HYPH|nr:tetratricopeptide repeat protein [Ensifer oleiphilus]NVD40066.1 tetratricopeptide repeat protein [Ensifer oleiphilus]